MRVHKTDLQEVRLIELDVFADRRGFFMETYQQKRYQEMGISSVFVQDNLSRSTAGILRGLHYQHPRAQAKLVQVIQGHIFDVVVDIRTASPSFGTWTAIHLSDEKPCQLFVPAGFAHGFCVLSELALVAYKCSDFYSPQSEGGVLWSDPDLKIDWPIKEPTTSEKDGSYPRLRDIPPERLPSYPGP